MNNTRQHPEGYLIAMGILIGIPLGAALALATGIIGLIGVGLPIHQVIPRFG